MGALVVILVLLLVMTLFFCFLKSLTREDPGLFQHGDDDNEGVEFTDLGADDAVKAVAQDPQTYLQMSRDKIEKVLNRVGLEWDDVSPVLSQLDTVDEIEEFLEDPPAFCRRMWEEGQCGGWRAALVSVRARLFLCLRLFCLLVLSVMGTTAPALPTPPPIPTRPTARRPRPPNGSLALVNQGKDNASVTRLICLIVARKSSTSPGRVAKPMRKIAINLARMPLEPRLLQYGLPWAFAAQGLEAVTSPDELQQACAVTPTLLLGGVFSSRSVSSNHRLIDQLSCPCGEEKNPTRCGPSRVASSPRYYVAIGELSSCARASWNQQRS